MDNVGVEIGKIAADGAGEAGREAIFGALGNGEAGQADEVSGRGECRRIGRRRVDSHRVALAQKIADEPVERLVGAVADVIIIAREKGDAEWRRHGGGIAEVRGGG